VNGIFTVPTALRVIRREDPDVKIGQQYPTNSLKYIFVAGENCDQDTKAWAETTFKVMPTIRFHMFHWWTLRPKYDL